MSDLREAIRQAIDDGVLTHSGRSVGDRASERVADAVLGIVDWHLGLARTDALFDAAHGISLITNRYVERDAVIRVLEQWGTDPNRLGRRPTQHDYRQENKS